MGWSISVGSEQSTNEGANQSTVTAHVYLSWSGGAWFWNINHTGRINIGGADYYYSVNTVNYPGQTNSGTVRVASQSHTFTHDANGYRGSCTTWADISGDITGYMSAGGPTQPAIDYDRKPATPTSLSASLNSNKTVTLTSNAVSSPAGTATYRFEYAYSTDNGASWSGWSTESTTESNTITLNLTYGRLYQFRVRVSNSDGYSNYYQPGSTLFVPAGGKIWNGSTFINATTSKIHKGGGVWNTVTLAKRHTGSNVWVDLK